MSASSRLFVLLHHVLSDSEHWDLCLDTGEHLSTWQLLDQPSGVGGTGGNVIIPARRIADHRKQYLDYEGPVSRNRGHVRRIDRGSYTLVTRRDDCWVIRFTGCILIGTYELTTGKNPGDPWRFQRVGP